MHCVGNLCTCEQLVVKDTSFSKDITSDLLNEQNSLNFLLINNVVAILENSVYKYLIAQLIKNLPAVQETWVQSLGWEHPPGEWIGYPLQYSSLEKSMDYIVHGVRKSWTRLSDFHLLTYERSFLSM